MHRHSDGSLTPGLRSHTRRTIKNGLANVQKFFNLHPSEIYCHNRFIKTAMSVRSASRSGITGELAETLCQRYVFCGDWYSGGNFVASLGEPIPVHCGVELQVLLDLCVQETYIDDAELISFKSSCYGSFEV